MFAGCFEFSDDGGKVQLYPGGGVLGEIVTLLLGADLAETELFQNLAVETKVGSEVRLAVERREEDDEERLRRQIKKRKFVVEDGRVLRVDL